jgi:hypothetical protein
MQVLVTGRRHVGDRKINMAPAEAFPLGSYLALPDHHVDAGVMPGKMSEHLSRKPCPDAPLRDIDRAGTNFPGTCQLGTPDGIIDFFDNRPRGSEAYFTGGRKRNAGSAPVENRGADFLFECPDLTRKGRLRQI